MARKYWRKDFFSESFQNANECGARTMLPELDIESITRGVQDIFLACSTARNSCSLSQHVLPKHYTIFKRRTRVTQEEQKDDYLRIKHCRNRLEMIEMFAQ